jgi:ureidoglycolate hydrolase
VPVEMNTDQLKNELFRPYGRILLPDNEEAPEVSEPDCFDFYVPFLESSRGWQIGYLINRVNFIDKLECHPTTPEVFSPLRGRTVMVVATDPERVNEFRAFDLTEPIVLNRGVWHGVISLTDQSEVLIVENPDVTDEYHRLSEPITVR